jgi:hypothetical protein
MRRTLKWTGWILAAVIAAALIVIALVVFGGRDPDWNGTVLLRWDAQRQALEVMARPRPGLDGPYVFRERRGYAAARMIERDGQWRVRWERLPDAPRSRLWVQVDNLARTRFDVPLRPPAIAGPADAPRDPPRLLMLSDFEGQFDRFVALLRAQGVLDADLRWSYGSGHVALVGDFVDRGEQVLPLLWLIYRMEGEAQRAGGRVHYLLGNHEQMLLRGDMESWPQRMRATAQRTDGGARRLFAEDSVLGQWLRTKPVVARIGDHLLAHGGISAEFLVSGLGVDAANALARPHLHTRTVRLPARVRPVLGRTGTTRYRGLARPEARREADPIAHLRAVVARHGVRRVAIGHTIAPNIVLEQRGLLLRLDVHHASQVAQAALYENGVLWRVYADGRRVRLQ